MACLKPLNGEPLTYWESGGDVFTRCDGHSVCITFNAHALRKLYQTEARAAWNAGDRKAAHRATVLWAELTKALDAREDWIKAATAQNLWRAA